MRRHPAPDAPHPDDVEHLCELFKALSDPTRVRLVHLLNRRSSDVSDLVEALGLPQSTVSRHLATLRHARVVAADRRGTSMHYRLADVHVGDLLTEAFSHVQHERLGLPDHAEQDTLTESIH